MIFFSVFFFGLTEFAISFGICAMDVSIYFFSLILFEFETISFVLGDSLREDERSIFSRNVNNNLSNFDVYIERGRDLDFNYENLTLAAAWNNDNESSIESKKWLREKTFQFGEGKDEDRNRRFQTLESVERSNNRQLRRDETRKSPFNLIIRLSVGCTGTLVTTRHVLTAAHCVHNGTQLTINQRNFRVEIPSQNGRTSEYFATEIRLPRKWANNQTYSRFRARYDFSIITLSHRIPSYMNRPRVMISHTNVGTSHHHDVIQFAGFPTGVPSTMWRTVCSFRGARYIQEGNVLHLRRCSASPGYSGAGIFRVSQRNKVQLVGVVSHLLQKKNNGQKINYIVVSTFTRKKTALLCSMMNGESHWNHFCGASTRQRASDAVGGVPYVVFQLSNRN